MISQNAAELEAQSEPVEEQEQESSGSSRLLLWLIAFSLGILFLPLYLISTTIQENTLPLADELATLETQVAATAAPNPTEEALRMELLALNQQVNVLETVRDDLETNHIAWPAVMAVIADYDQGILRVSELMQVDTHVTVKGEANNEGAITSYADHLRESPYVENVAVQSLNLRILPTATPPPPADSETPTEVPAASTPNRVVDFTILIMLRTGSDAQPE
ncbi:MAG: hypothetical protein K8J31_17445 [Anaerolineae bacterium]|nr:hypothetical protein [Anaerolineae bacterium]